MAYTSDDLTSVETAIRNLIAGRRVASVTIGGETVQYSQVDLPQLRAIRDEIKGDVAEADGSEISSFYVVGSKGL